MSCKVGIVSLGCAKNRVGAEMILFSLRQADFIDCDPIATLVD